MSDKTGNHGAPPEKIPGSPIILIVLITVLVVALIILNRGKNHDSQANTTILAFIGLAVTQVVTAYRQEQNRRRIEEGESDTRHLVRGILNREGLQEEDTKQSQLAAIIKLVAEEVRIAERDQFWLSPQNREQLRLMFREVNEECRQANQVQIDQALLVHVQTYHPSAA